MKLFPFSRRTLATWGIAPVLMGGLLLQPVLPCTAQDQTADKTEYTLRRVYKAGEVDRYKMTLKVTISNPQLGGEIAVNFDGVMKETTKEVKEDGKAVVLTEFEKALATFGGMEMEVADQLPKATQTRDIMGRILSTKTEGGEGLFGSFSANNQQMINESQRRFYPDRPIKVGDSWKIFAESKSEADKEKGKESEKDKPVGTATFLGTEKVGDVTALKIKVVVDTDPPQGVGEQLGGDKGTKMHVEQTGLVDPATGKLLKITATTEGGPIKKLELSMNLVTGKEKAEKTEKEKGKGDAPQAAKRDQAVALDPAKPLPVVPTAEPIIK